MSKYPTSPAFSKDIVFIGIKKRLSTVCRNGTGKVCLQDFVSK